MENRYRFILDPTKGTKTKTTCPSCGKKSCFKLYYDTETGKYLDESCGRCDHENSCGYHLTPSMLFKDRPDIKASLFGTYHHDCFIKPYITHKTNVPSEVTVKSETEQVTFIDMKYVTSHQYPDDSFVPWLKNTIGNEETVNGVLSEYMVGSGKIGGYSHRPVIFWYIDCNGNVCDGKMMWYKEDGHRQQWVNWVSHKLTQAHILPDSIVVKKCLFGEHLLQKNPDKAVAIVESEKSALFCACIYPQYVWLSTGGCNGLNADKMHVLKGRRVVIFPDSGKLEEWKKRMSGTKDIRYSFIEELESLPSNSDIVDLLLTTERFK